MTTKKNIYSLSEYSSQEPKVELDSRPLAYYDGGGGGSDVVARIVKLEADVEYIKRDISEIKTDIKDFKSSVNNEFKAVNQKLDNIPIALAQFETRLEKRFTNIIQWFIGTAIAIGGISFAVARFFTS